MKTPRIETVKTVALAMVIGLAIGVGLGFKWSDGLQAKYSKQPIVQVSTDTQSK